MLKPPLGEDRHVDAGNGLYAATNDLPFQRVERGHVVARQLGEGNRLGDVDDIRPGIGAETGEAVRVAGA